MFGQFSLYILCDTHTNKLIIAILKYPKLRLAVISIDILNNNLDVDMYAKFGGDILTCLGDILQKHSLTEVSDLSSCLSLIQ